MTYDLLRGFFFFLVPSFWQMNSLKRTYQRWTNLTVDMSFWCLPACTHLFLACNQVHRLAMKNNRLWIKKYWQTLLKWKSLLTFFKKWTWISAMASTCKRTMILLKNLTIDTLFFVFQRKTEKPDSMWLSLSPLLLVIWTWSILPATPQDFRYEGKKLKNVYSFFHQTSNQQRPQLSVLSHRPTNKRNNNQLENAGEVQLKWMK